MHDQQRRRRYARQTTRTRSTCTRQAPEPSCSTKPGPKVRHHPRPVNAKNPENHLPKIIYPPLCRRRPAFVFGFIGPLGCNKGKITAARAAASCRGGGVATQSCWIQPGMHDDNTHTCLLIVRSNITRSRRRQDNPGQGRRLDFDSAHIIITVLLTLLFVILSHHSRSRHYLETTTPPQPATPPPPHHHNTMSPTTSQPIPNANANAVASTSSAASTPSASPQQATNMPSSAATGGQLEDRLNALLSSFDIGTHGLCREERRTGEFGESSRERAGVRVCGCASSSSSTPRRVCCVQHTPSSPRLPAPRSQANTPQPSPTPKPSPSPPLATPRHRARRSSRCSA